MSELTQLKLEPTDGEKKIKKSQTINEHLEKTITDELIIGLCGPIGTDVNYISKYLKEILEDAFNYRCIEISLSGFIKKIHDIKKTDKRDYNYYDDLIKKGNQLRKKHENDILSKLAIHTITFDRTENSDDDENSEDLVYSKRVCYIINSIKNVDEYNLFKKVYNNIFYFIGVFSPLDIRKKNLKDKGLENHDIEKLLEIDSEQPETFGQKVSKTFPLSDYFLRIEESHEEFVKKKLSRFLDLIFGTQIITPNNNETAMYMAHSAAANSACLSRQVGASITNSKGEIISVGWNDVPKYGGNLYNSSDEFSKDHRCLNKKGGKCFNDDEKNYLSNLLVEDLIKNNIISAKQENDVFKIIRESRIKDLIEFSRSVHAEMHAMINATQKSGSEIIGGKLFCTTYPCHNCARHIIAAGVVEVYYIEPYKKSLALKLHDDSMTERHNDKDRVKILMYDGVSPNRYIDLFKITHGTDRKEKDKGIKTIIKRNNASPRKSMSLDAIPFLERKATKELEKIDTFEKVIT
jgi:deoxycytidylate deaminase